MRGTLQRLLAWPALLVALAGPPACSAQQQEGGGGGGGNTTTTVPTPYRLQTPPLDTPWTARVGLAPWPEHPRPQLRRGDDGWRSLNGLWTWQAAGAGNASAAAGAAAPPPPGPLAREVLVPFCIESALSGLQDLDATSMWYRTAFAVPPAWAGAGGAGGAGRRVVLHLEAVDYEHTVFVNGARVGDARGGYFRHSLDVTDYLRPNGTNELQVFVFDPTDLVPHVIPIGKQTRRPEHIFYRPCSGIWQTVWLESAPAERITQLDVTADADGALTVRAHTNTEGGGGNGTVVVVVEVEVLAEDGRVLASGRGGAGALEVALHVPGVRPWTPDAPTLYNLTVSLGSGDRVSSYTGFRTVGRGVVDGVPRPLLNGEFVFKFATLDQGFWPDGIHTPPSYEAMVFDLKELKKLGFNTVRKHIKVEPDLFYWACDSLGLMVIQDMPSMSPRVAPPDAAQQAEFERQLGVLVEEHLSYTCIVTWIIYNEGWGQLLAPPYPEAALARRVAARDPTRLVDATSGWYDHGAGDFADNHHYASPQCGTPWYSIQSRPYDDVRIGFQGEFGGIGHNVSLANLWNVQAAIDTINQTYEVSADLAAFNYRAHALLGELREQVERFACSGGVWTQTTDVEGEVNGLVTYDRRVERVDVRQWQDDIRGLYAAAAARGGYGNATATAAVPRV